MPIVAPSLLAADFSDLKSAVALAEKGGADWLHLDVMDGQFVPNLTIGPPVIRSLRKLTGLPFDTHLMIEKPDHLLEDFREAGADLITVHVEACTHLHRTVHRIKELGAKAGVSMNPATPVGLIADILPEVDLVLVMTVNPGFGAQSFIVHSLEKIREAAAMIRRIKPEVYLEVDGGIDGTTAPLVVAAGATVLVAGNFVFGSKDPAAAIHLLKSASPGVKNPDRRDSASV